MPAKLLIALGFMSVMSVNADTADGKATTSSVPRPKTPKAGSEPSLTWALAIVKEFCWRMREDYQVKISERDFLEYGSREQIICFAREIAECNGDLEEFCNTFAKKWKPFYFGKVKAQ